MAPGILGGHAQFCLLGTTPEQCGSREKTQLEPGGLHGEALRCRVWERGCREAGVGVHTQRRPIPKWREVEGLWGCQMGGQTPHMLMGTWQGSARHSPQNPVMTRLGARWNINKYPTPSLLGSIGRRMWGEAFSQHTVNSLS